MSRPTLAIVKYFIDADLRGLAKLACQERTDTTYLGDPGKTIRKRRRPECPIPMTAVKDVDWIPEVAERGWLIITRDRHIQQHTRERHAVRDHGAKMVNFDSADAKTIWSQLEVMLTRWREIEQMLTEPGPFIYGLSRTGSKRKILLD